MRSRGPGTAIGAFLLLLAVGCGGGGGGGGATPSSDADLLLLDLSSGSLSPAFDAAITDYDVGPAVLPESVTVTADTADAGATLRVDGSTVTPGMPSLPIALAMGTTLVSVEVTAADGTTRKTYSIAIDRTSAELAGLLAQAGPLQPAFDAAAFSYTVGPAIEPAKSRVGALAADPDATIRVNGTVVASGTPSAPVPLAGGLTPVTVEVTARDGVSTSTYTVLFDRSVGGQQAYVKASNTEADDANGYSVAISGDTLVVGAHSEDSGATGVGGDESDDSAPSAGAAYVFVRSGATWSQQAYLKASNTGSGDYFGLSVAISGDTLVVGAYREGSGATGVGGDESDDSALQSGAAYVFVRSGATWSQQAYLKASNTGSGDDFGWSVAISDDTLVVGAYGEDSGATGVGGDESDDSAPSAGAAYVFVRSGATWSQQAYLKASNTGSSDYFGRSVAISDDTLVVGAYGEDSGATGVGGDESDDSAPLAGAAYVFVRSGATWSQQAYLKASNTGSSDEFGWSVAISGDTLVVGAFGEDSGATGVGGDESDDSAPLAGAAYVFVRSGATWSQQAYLKASNTDSDDYFGWSVAISDDTLVVGAYGEDSGATGVGGDESDDSAPSAGAAYVFVRSGATWSQQAYLKASNTGSSDYFGRSVAISDDTLVVGAYGEDSGATGVGGDESDDSANYSGAAYVFR